MFLLPVRHVLLPVVDGACVPIVGGASLCLIHSVVFSCWGLSACFLTCLQANGWNVQSHSPCAAALQDMEAKMGPINPYNILGKCFQPPSSSRSTPHTPADLAVPATAGSSSIGADHRLLRLSRRLQQQQQHGQQQQETTGLQLASAVGTGRLRAAQQLRHAVTCADRQYAAVYYNSPEVRAAIHAAASLPFGR